MGKGRFNAKARQVKETLIDDSSLKNIKIDFNNSESKGYDESNPLVLPSNKRKTKVKAPSVHVTRILSKKQRKNLEKIVDKKKKKEQRSFLLESLSSVQIPAEELKNYTSISTIQTVGIKKFGAIKKFLPSTQELENGDKSSGRVSSIAGRNKRKLLALLGEKAGEDDEEFVGSKKRKNPNIVGLDSSSSSSEEEDGDDDNVEEVMDEVKVEEEEQEVETDSTVVSKEDSSVAKAVDEKIEIATPKSSEKVKKSPKVPTQPTKPTTYVHVERSAEIQASRLKLPILAEEQTIMETINENSIIIVSGETGSGKTTQIPQFLYEAGYAEKKMIGITEPRRVAAISMSKRVAKEMSLSEKEVSYLIRFDGNVTDKTKIKFMTDGVLLKEIESDFLLKNYSVIILDEAHERSSYTDILIGLLSRIVPLRNKVGNTLKLIVMSATLRVEDFMNNTKLFKVPPPLINVEARQFPVTAHFQKRTVDDYVNEAYRKTVKIHSKLPEGGILIFLTGQKEVNYLVKKLRKAFPYQQTDKVKRPAEESKSTPDNEDEDDFDMQKALKNIKKAKKKFAAEVSLPRIDLDSYMLPTDDTQADLLDTSNPNDDEYNSDDSAEDDDLKEENEDVAMTRQPLWVLPLYSLLSAEKQNRIFQPPPEGTRLCIVSTNVAETSLTIPNIKYVVDSGRQKTRLYDKVTGVSAFVVTYTSKASADQRAGRAGRTSAGHCYRLYSSAVYNDEFVDFSTPDIQKKPVDDLMLQMKCMGIHKVINFPFPSPPDRTQLEMAEKRLVMLGALEEPEQDALPSAQVTNVTALGRAISVFPVAPRFGKMLALSHQHNLLPYTVSLVAALSVQEILSEVGMNEEGNFSNKWQHIRNNWAGTGNFRLLGDPMVLLRAVGAAEFAGSENKLEEFCSKNGLRLKGVSEIRKLRVQLTNEINLNLSDVNLCVDPKMPPPSDVQAKLLRQILLAGMGDRVARKIPDDQLHTKEDKRKFKYAYNCLDLEEPVYMHSSSVLKKDLPEWVVYQEAYEIQNGDSKKVFIRGITAIEPEWLVVYAPKLCAIRAIKEDPVPRYDEQSGNIYAYVDATFGKAAWEIPLAEVKMPQNERAYRYFGMYFLNGDVFPKLLQYKERLKSTPSSLLKVWSNLNEFVTRFIAALAKKRINSKQALLDVWKSEPTYLMRQYADLLYNVEVGELSMIWPSLNEL